jgi:hypothetical protein
MLFRGITVRKDVSFTHHPGTRVLLKLLLSERNRSVVVIQVREIAVL